MIFILNIKKIVSKKLVDCLQDMVASVRDITDSVADTFDFYHFSLIQVFSFLFLIFSLMNDRTEKNQFLTRQKVPLSNMKNNEQMGDKSPAFPEAAQATDDLSTTVTLTPFLAK